MNFIPLFTGIFIGLISIVLLFIPVTKTEQQFWSILQIRKLRHWVTTSKTEKWNFGKEEHNIIEISLKNIKWHILLTFVFSFLMLRAQYTNNLLQLISHFLLIPIFAFFIGSIIQRQKIGILTNRQKLKDKVRKHSKV